jgi:hypothetical protein
MKVIAISFLIIDWIIKIQPLNYSLTMPIYEPLGELVSRESQLSLAIQQQKKI